VRSAMVGPDGSQATRQVPLETFSSKAHQDWLAERRRQNPLDPQPIGERPRLVGGVNLGVRQVKIPTSRWRRVWAAVRQAWSE
jgi:hypothetical protein